MVRRLCDPCVLCGSNSMDAMCDELINAMDP
jgi:hypothetical protein